MTCLTGWEWDKKECFSEEKLQVMVCTPSVQEAVLHKVFPVQFIQLTNVVYLSADPDDIMSPSGDQEHLIKF